MDPPGGLSGTCPSPTDYDGGSISFIDVKEYWLDVTGNYPGLTTGVDGYIGGGQGGVLYCTHNSLHFPLARNIENFQIEYNGDMDNDLVLDGWTPWQVGWPISQTSRVQQVRIWILGRTAQAFTSVGGKVPGTTPVKVYRRPAVPNTPAAVTDDFHKRYLLDSTSNVRNMILNLYNLDQR